MSMSSFIHHLRKFFPQKFQEHLIGGPASAKFYKDRLEVEYLPGSGVSKTNEFDGIA